MSQVDSLVHIADAAGFVENFKCFVTDLYGFGLDLRCLAFTSFST